MLRCIGSWLARLLPTLLVLLVSPALAAGAPRLALVVGNAAYPARPLATAANDASLVAQALAQAGFDVSAARDLDATSLRATLAAFVDAARTAGPDATLLVYLTGYGAQYDGGNFLVPVDAQLVHDDDVPAETASLDDLARALAAVPAKARLLVYDLARPHPFATVDEMPLAPGLALTTAPQGTIVAFAAAPGMVAPDDALPYGAYARALSETIAAPGVPANAMFDRVRLRVGELTNGEQVPWDDGAVDANVTLTSAAAPVPATAPAPAAGGLSPDDAYSVVIARDTLASYAELLRVVPDGPIATRIRVLQAVRREEMIWQAAAASDDPRAAWTYMRRYPRGPHRFDARRRLAALHAPLEPPPRFDVFVFPALPPPTPAELALVAAPEEALHGLPPIPPPSPALLPPADPAYYEELPMPAPAPAGLLPIAPPLPGAAAGEPGRITQTRPGRGITVTETQIAPNGSASVTLADAAGPVLELVAGDAFGDARTLVETGPEPAVAGNADTPAKDGPDAPAKGNTVPAGPAKSDPAAVPKSTRPTRDARTGPPVLSRTVVLRTADGVTMAQVGADGDTLLEITTRADADGSRTTRVTNGRDDLLASWRRDPQGIVIARDAATVAAGTALAAVPPKAISPKPVSPKPVSPGTATTTTTTSAATARPLTPLAPPAPAAAPVSAVPQAPASPLPAPAHPGAPTPAPTPAPPAPREPPSTASPVIPSPAAAPLPPRRPAGIASKPTAGPPKARPGHKAPAGRAAAHHGRR